MASGGAAVRRCGGQPSTVISTYVLSPTRGFLDLEIRTIQCSIILFSFLESGC